MDYDSLWKAVKKGQKVLYSANTWLRAMFHGGLNHLDVIAACNLFRVVSVLRSRGQAFWSLRSGSPVAELRRWFRLGGSWRCLLGSGAIWIILPFGCLLGPLTKFISSVYEPFHQGGLEVLLLGSVSSNFSS